MAAQVATVQPIKNPSGKTFTRAEVARHNKKGDLWIVCDTAVYDLSKFAALHPGGEGVLVSAAAAWVLWQGLSSLSLSLSPSPSLLHPASPPLGLRISHASHCRPSEGDTGD